MPGLADARYVSLESYRRGGRAVRTPVWIVRCYGCGGQNAADFVGVELRPAASRA